MEYQATTDGPAPGVVLSAEGFRLYLPLGPAIHETGTAPTMDFDGVVWTESGTPWDLLPAIHPEVPFYLPGQTRRLCGAMAASLGLGFPDHKYLIFDHGKPFTVGPFRVTAWSLGRGDGDGFALHVVAGDTGILTTAQGVVGAVPPSTLKALGRLDGKQMAAMVSPAGALPDGTGKPVAESDRNFESGTPAGEAVLIQDLADRRLPILGTGHATHVLRGIAWAAKLGRLPVVDLVTAQVVARHRPGGSRTPLRLFTRDPRPMALMGALAGKPPLFSTDSPVRHPGNHLTLPDIVREAGRYFPILTPGLAEEVFARVSAKHGAHGEVVLLGGMGRTLPGTGDGQLGERSRRRSPNRWDHRTKGQDLEASLSTTPLVMEIANESRPRAPGNFEGGRMVLRRPKPPLPAALIRALSHLQGIPRVEIEIA